jgi:imidazoleglycerol-phosphate dehydratase
MTARRAEIARATSETDIRVSLDLDGTGQATIATGVGFLDHMLTALARHALLDLTVQAKGDLHIDDHHTTEDVGIVIGQAIRQALGDKRGIRRYGAALIPMDEALAEAALDVSGRPFLAWSVVFQRPKIGTFDTELVETFWQAFAANALCNLHFVLHHGTNSHHIAESMWKGAARALRQATTIDPRQTGVPSSKGTLIG